MTAKLNDSSPVHCAPVRIGAGVRVHAGTLSCDSTPGNPLYVPRCGSGAGWNNEEFHVSTGAPVDEEITCRHCIRNHPETVRRAQEGRASVRGQAELAARAAAIEGARTVVQHRTDNGNHWQATWHRTGKPGLWRQTHTPGRGIPCEHLATTEQLLATSETVTPAPAGGGEPAAPAWVAVYVSNAHDAGDGVTVWGVYDAADDTYQGELWQGRDGFAAWRNGYGATPELHASGPAAFADLFWLETVPADEVRPGMMIVLSDGSVAGVTGIDPNGEFEFEKADEVRLTIEPTGDVFDLLSVSPADVPLTGPATTLVLHAAGKVTLTPPCRTCETGAGEQCGPMAHDPGEPGNWRDGTHGQIGRLWRAAGLVAETVREALDTRLPDVFGVEFEAVEAPETTLLFGDGNVFTRADADSELTPFDVELELFDAFGPVEFGTSLAVIPALLQWRFGHAADVVAWLVEQENASHSRGVPA